MCSSTSDETIQRFAARGGMTVAEFNAFASPTTPAVRARMETLFGVRWTKWAVRYWPHLEDMNEVPAWLGRLYEQVYERPYDLRGGGLVFVHEDSKLVVLRAGKELLPDVITHVTENLAWANDNKTLFYGKQDETTLRQYQIYRHVVGTDLSEDPLVFQEDDETFVTYIFKTKSKRFLMLVSSQTISQEYRYLDADNPTGEFKMFLPR